ncbi:hypothetical protein QUA00_26380 [Microcoleus sp. T2B6]|uniref:hypothetical protein n=1 Tax=Microcoleus sp. T2B6 TaxID=3055424 RepID=UPI002FD30C78
MQAPKHYLQTLESIGEIDYSNPKSFVKICRGSATPTPRAYPSQGGATGRGFCPYKNYTNHLGLLYNPVPPKRSERVIMRAQFKGRKKPLPYIFDEERS